MRYTIFTERSRWNGNIHICAIFKTPREQELLGNLPAGVTSASDHCSAGRYGFHSTTPPPSLSAVSTHRVAWGCTKKSCYLALSYDFTYLTLLSHSVQYIIMLLMLTIDCAFQNFNKGSVTASWKHTEIEIQTMFSPPCPFLAWQRCELFRFHHVTVTEIHFLWIPERLLFDTHTQGWHTSKASTYFSSHVVQIRTFQHPHNVWLRLETARDIIIQEWECMANVLVWRATSVAPC